MPANCSRNRNLYASLPSNLLFSAQFTQMAGLHFNHLHVTFKIRSGRSLPVYRSTILLSFGLPSMLSSCPLIPCAPCQPFITVFQFQIFLPSAGTSATWRRLITSDSPKVIAILLIQGLKFPLHGKLPIHTKIEHLVPLTSHNRPRYLATYLRN